MSKRKSIHCVGVPVERFNDHISIARNTVSAMRATGARAVLVSSFWSYGPVRTNPVSETHPRKPWSEKERVRKDQESLFQEAAAAVTVLPDFYGPDADIGFLNPALRTIEAGKTANWIGRLDAPRELIYVPDAASPLVELARHDKAYGERWNVSGPGAVTARRLIEIAAAHCVTAPRLRTANRLTAGRSRTIQLSSARHQGPVSPVHEPADSGHQQAEEPHRRLSGHLLRRRHSKDD